MKVAVSMLADYAQAHPDGKLYVTGGGIRVLRFPSFPATQPKLALALGLEVSVAEMGVAHVMAIEARGPTSEPVTKPVALTFTIPPSAADGGNAGYFHFVSSMEHLAFPTEGAYSFVVVIDGEPVEELNLLVVRSVTEQLSGEMEATQLLVDGYQAFVAGDVDSAEHMFRNVVDRFPGLSHGHNNLGFVLLSRGDPAGARDAFLKAKELGYLQTELNDANTACALYLLRDWAAALAMFEQCLHAQLFRGPATLFGIGPTGLFPVPLTSASDYLALMTLNAAWSASAAGDATKAAHYLEIVRMAELTAPDHPSRQQFAESVTELRGGAAD